MATIKSYTDLEQSKRLAEILPLESADMDYIPVVNLKGEYAISVNEWDNDHILDEDWIPCWSLAALLNLLPNEISTDDRFECHYQIHIRKYDGGDNTTLFQIAYGNNRSLSGSWHDMINTGEKECLIDCCVQMILKLHELNLYYEKLYRFRPK